MSATVTWYVEFYLLRSHIDENLVLTLGLQCFFNPRSLYVLRPLQVTDICSGLEARVQLACFYEEEV
jgi:hypothetical protein